MLSLCLSLSLFAAPVPKGGNQYEGHIAFMIRSPEPAIVILKPSGELLRKVEMEKIKGQVSTIRQSRNAEFALVGSIDPQTGDSIVYRVDLVKKGEVKEWIKATNGVETICIAKDGKSAIYSEPDLDPNKPNDFEGYRHWTIDTATGKKTKLELGSEFKIQDRGQEDDDVIMADYFPANNFEDTRTAILSLKTKQISFKSEIEVTGLCLFGDNKSFLMNNVRNVDGKATQGLEIFSIQNKKSTVIAKPDRGNQYCYSAAPDAKYMVYCQRSNDGTSVYVVQVAQNQARKVYTFKDGEDVSDCDWR
jgi:hypothetical protein